MLLFRSLAIGLLGACVLLLAQHHAPERVRPERIRIEHERELVALRPAMVAPTIIDVAPGLSATQLAQLVHLGGDERVTSIDDRPVQGTLDAGTLLDAPASHGFLDLTVSGRSGERRVLVLVH